MSIFTPHIQNMIKLYREIGFKLKYLEDNLIKFDCYCDEHDYKNINLSEQFAEEWIYSYKTNSKQQLDKRVRTIKYLGKYLNSIGIQAYIPKYTIKSDPPKPPTLPTKDELLTIFQAIDLLTPTKKYPYRSYLLPVIFRLIYSCGLRVSEVCNIQINDINLNNGKLTIWHSKGNKDRELYMDASMLNLCVRFNQTYSNILPAREYFFQPSYEIIKFKNTYIDNTFEKILEITGLINKHPIHPTPHSLRHLFACKSMEKCLKMGYDFNNWIKYLSVYMGHESPQETMYYLHIISALVPKYAEIMKKLELGIGVIHEEY